MFFSKASFRTWAFFAGGVEVVEQDADADPASGGFAQSVKQAVGGVVGKNRVVLDIQRFLRRLDQRHAAGEGQLGTADQRKARIVAGAGFGSAGGFGLPEAGVAGVGQRGGHGPCNVGG